MENFSLRLKVISLASNVYVKGFVSETTDKALLAPGQTAEALVKITPWREVGGIQTFVFQGETQGTQSRGKVPWDGGRWRPSWARIQLLSGPGG